MHLHQWKTWQHLTQTAGFVPSHLCGLGFLSTFVRHAVHHLLVLASAVVAPVEVASAVVVGGVIEGGVVVVDLVEVATVVVGVFVGAVVVDSVQVQAAIAVAAVVFEGVVVVVVDDSARLVALDSDEPAVDSAHVVYARSSRYHSEDCFSSLRMPHPPMTC